MRLGQVLQLALGGALVVGASFIGCTTGTTGSNYDLSLAGHDLSVLGIDLAGVDFT
jgi:hypothetical protein